MIRIGLVGSGFMGRTHAAAWAKTDAIVAGVLSKHGQSAQALAKECAAQVYNNLAAMLHDIDVVDICTPTYLHHEQVLQAAAAGKHIVCEKPLARTVAQGQEMIQACQAAGVKLLVAHVVRYFPEYAQAKAQVAGGQIGKPAVIRLTRGTFQPKKAQENWFVEFDKSGGMMLDLMIHDFDYARWVGGEVESVFAKKMGNSHPHAKGDYGLVILKHRNGTLSHVEGSWAYPPPLFRTRFEIAGSEGLIEFDSQKRAAISHHLHQDESDVPDVPLPSSPLSEDPYHTQLNAFYHHLVHDKPIRVSERDGLAALQIALAAIDSAESGRAIQLQPLPEVEK